MAEDQNPTGKFGISRLSDIGPLVSHHNTPSADCDKKVCFDGHTKEEVFRSIKDAFLFHKDDFKQELIDNNMDVEEIVIVGSVVRGNFGCRSLEKAKKELRQVINRQWRDRPEISQSAVSVGDDLLVQESVQSIWEMAENRLTGLPEEEILKDDVRIAICSDIDLSVIVGGNVPEKKWDSRKIRQIRNEFTNKMSNDTLGNMIYIENVSSKERFEEVQNMITDKRRQGSLSSKEDFEAIIRRHYQ